MGHIGKEFCFCMIWHFLRTGKLFQCPAGFNLCFLLLCHIRGCQQYLSSFPSISFKEYESDFISLFIELQYSIINISFSLFNFPGYFPEGAIRISTCFQLGSSVLYAFQNLHLKIMMIRSPEFLYHLSIQIVEFISVIFPDLEQLTAVNQTHYIL